MKTENLPPSNNIEDRRGEVPSMKPRYTLAEMLAMGVGACAVVISKLSKAAGIDDIKPR